MKKTKITDAIRTKVRGMRAGGAFVRAIADDVGIAKSTVERILRDSAEKSFQAHKANGTRSMDLERIDMQIAELQARRKILSSRDRARDRLVEFCNANGLNRADLRAVIDRLPLVRISRKHREARANQK